MTKLSQAIQLRLTKIKAATENLSCQSAVFRLAHEVEQADSWDKWQTLLDTLEGKVIDSVRTLKTVDQLRAANLQLALLKTAVHAAYDYATDPDNARGKLGRKKDVDARRATLVAYYQNWMEHKAHFQVAIGSLDAHRYLFLPRDQHEVIARLADDVPFIEWLDVESAASVPLSPREKKWDDIKQLLANADPSKFDQVDGRRVDPFVEWQKSFYRRGRLSPDSLNTEKGNLENFTKQVVDYKEAIDKAYSYALQSESLGGWKGLSQAVREVDWPVRLLMINEHQSRWQSWHGLCEQWRIYLQFQDDQVIQFRVSPEDEETPVGRLEQEIRNALDSFKCAVPQVPRPHVSSQEALVTGQAVVVDKNHFVDISLKDAKEKSAGCFTMPSRGVGIGLFALGGGAAAATLLITLVGKVAAIATVSAIAWPVTVFLLAMGAGIIYHHYQQDKAGLFKSGGASVDGSGYIPGTGPGAKG